VCRAMALHMGVRSYSYTPANKVFPTTGSNVISTSSCQWIHFLCSLFLGRAFHRRGRLGRAAFLDRVTTATAPLSSRGGGAI